MNMHEKKKGINEVPHLYHQTWVEVHNVTLNRSEIDTDLKKTKGTPTDQK